MDGKPLYWENVCRDAAPPTPPLSSSTSSFSGTSPSPPSSESLNGHPVEFDVQMMLSLLPNNQTINSLPKDPRQWGVKETTVWLYCVFNEYELNANDLDVSQNVTGKMLMEWDGLKFTERLGLSGDVVKSVLDLWVVANLASGSTPVVMPETPQTPGTSGMSQLSVEQREVDSNQRTDENQNGKVQSCVSPMQHRTKKKRTEATHTSVKRQRANVSGLSSDSSSSNEQAVNAAPRKVQRKRSKKVHCPLPALPIIPNSETSGIQVWQFLLELLLHPSHYKHIIHWTNPDTNDGVFKIEDTEVVASLWGLFPTGRAKNKMNFDKMSRSMRFHYKNEVLLKVDGTKQYRFGRNSFWQSHKSLVTGFDHTHEGSMELQQYSRVSHRRSVDDTDQRSSSSCSSSSCSSSKDSDGAKSQINSSPSPGSDQPTSLSPLSMRET